MTIPLRALSLCLLFVVLNGSNLNAQDQPELPDKLANGGLEDSGDDGMPVGWNFPATLRDAGYEVELDSGNPFAGDTAAKLDATGIEENAQTFGNLMQLLDAKPYRGQRVRFRAAVRTADLEDDGRAQLWFRVDRQSEGGTPKIGAFDNMQDRPIREQEWKHYEIVGDVDEDAERISVGLLFLGKGKAWIDDASFEVVNSATPPTTDANTNQSNANRQSAGPSSNPDPQPFWTPWLFLVLSRSSFSFWPSGLPRSVPPNWHFCSELHFGFRCSIGSFTACRFRSAIYCPLGKRNSFKSMPRSPRSLFIGRPPMSLESNRSCFRPVAAATRLSTTSDCLSVSPWR